MTTALISHTRTAAPLAALLPARRGVAWTVEPAPQLLRAGAAISRLVQGERALDVVELDGRVEVYADRADMVPAPDVVVTETGPDPVTALAALVLRIVLPRLEREAAEGTLIAHGRDQVIIDTAQHLNEVGFALIDHGAYVVPTGRPDGGVGLEWTADNGAEWGLWVLPANGNLSLSYEGPVGGLYALLPVLLPTVEVHRPAFTGSAFTRHLTGRFPQLHPLSADEVEFGRRDDVSGYIALPSSDEPTDYADDGRRIAAHFGGIGADLALTAVQHLV